MKNFRINENITVVDCIATNKEKGTKFNYLYSLNK